MTQIDDQLRKAVTEYYEYQGDADAEPIRFVENKHSKEIREAVNGEGFCGYTMLLVRFTDKQGKEPVEMSALMDYQEWNDGHWDVTEMDARPRKCEDCLIRQFEESEEFI